MSGAYYNELDPFAAEWLRQLIKAGHISQGEVDERSIEQVEPQDLAGFTQCHFFAGIGVWSYALRLAGWPDEQPVWTGSCPCPSFSVAGKGKGFDDPRHLWPAWFRLIRECRPATVFGEQVDGAIRHGWLDLVQTDLEAEGYAVGKAVLGACSVGAPHRRQRLYFVAGYQRDQEHQEQPRSTADERERGTDGIGGRGASGELGDTGEPGLEGFRRPVEQRNTEGRETSQRHGATAGGDGFMGNAERIGSSSEQQLGEAQGARRLREPQGPSGITRGFWRDAEWLWCRDGKYRPVEPGTFPLATGITGRVGRLRGYGDAICAPTAKAFIEAYMSVAREHDSAWVGDCGIDIK